MSDVLVFQELTHMERKFVCGGSEEIRSIEECCNCYFKFACVVLTSILCVIASFLAYAGIFIAVANAGSDDVKTQKV